MAGAAGAAVAALRHGHSYDNGQHHHQYHSEHTDHSEVVYVHEEMGGLRSPAHREKDDGLPNNPEAVVGPADECEEDCDVDQKKGVEPMTPRSLSDDVREACAYFTSRMSWMSNSLMVEVAPNWKTKLLSSPIFDTLVGFVIVANTCTIGVEQTLRLKHEDTTVVDWLEHIFLVVYIVELGLRLSEYGISALKENWVRFDLLLVVLGVVTGWILAPLLGQIDGIGFLMVLRTLRLLRLARTVRLLIQFRELWMLVRGLLDSASTMLYTLLMLITTIYIFSSIGIEIITKHKWGPHGNPDEIDQDFAAHIEKHFGSLPMTMLTLMQFVSLDSLNIIYMPLVKKDPRLIVYFAGILIVIGIVLMNLITAVVVNSALDQAYQDKELMRIREEKTKKKLVMEMRRIFVRLDEDNSGEVSEEEIGNISDEDRKNLETLMAVADPVEIFRALDVDRSGSLGIDEFCDGIWQEVARKGNLELKRVEKKVDAMRGRLETIEGVAKSIEKAMGKQEASSPSGSPLSSPPQQPQAALSKDISHALSREVELMKVSILQAHQHALAELKEHIWSSVQEATSSKPWNRRATNKGPEAPAPTPAFPTKALREADAAAAARAAAVDAAAAADAVTCRGAAFAGLQGYGLSEHDLRAEIDCLRKQLAAADEALVRVLQRSERTRVSAVRPAARAAEAAAEAKAAEAETLTAPAEPTAVRVRSKPSLTVLPPATPVAAWQLLHQSPGTT